MAEQASLDKWYDLQETNFNESVAEAEKQILESQKRLAEKQRRIQEEQLLDISDFYFDLFSGNTGNIWKDFKRQGLGVISDIAAKWTLALITGQDLETALEKALMIEELPKLLQQRLDPVGYALDQINDKFERLAEGKAQEALQGAIGLYRGELLESLFLTETAFDEWASG